MTVSRVAPWLVLGVSWPLIGASGCMIGRSFVTLPLQSGVQSDVLI